MALGDLIAYDSVMLTRVEIDGFKSFENFSVDLPAFAVVVGPNAVGKSNFFDALRLLSRLVTVDVQSAVQDLRGEPSELFRFNGDERRSDHITIAVEVLLNKTVKDPYGKLHDLKGMRARYEIVVERRRAGSDTPERLYIRREEARLVRRAEDRMFKALTPAAARALTAWAPATQKKPELIITDSADATLVVSQDGGQGRPQKVPLGAATASFLSTVRTADQFLHLFALRDMISRIRYLQLDAARSRLPSDVFAQGELQPDGSNLAAVLARIVDETKDSSRPQGALNDIRRELARLVPGTSDIEVVRNEVARQYQIFLTAQDASRFSSRVLSDGTLRLLSLLTFLHDPKRSSVLCFEEPENGVHEGRIPALIELLRSFTSDLSSPPETDDIVSQIIVNSHSPVVMKELHDTELVAADMVVSLDQAGRRKGRRTRMRTGVAHELPIASAADREHRLTRIELERLLRQQSEPIE